MIEVEGLTKRYGNHVAVESRSFVVRPGIVTGFLGPSASGKSTTMRMIVGLDRPTAGTARVNGRFYADHASPLREMGARALAVTTGISKRRLDEVIEVVGCAA